MMAATLTPWASAPVNPALARELAAELAAAPHGGKEGVLARWQAATGKSRSTLLRHAKAAGGYQPQERKPRADRGVSRAGITDHALQIVVALMAGSHRKTGSIECPTTEAVDDCVRAGVLPNGTSVETVRRRLREKGWGRRALQTAYTTDGQTVSAHHVRLVSEGPNHLHEVDVSACLHWYFRPRGGLGMRHKTLDLAGGKKAQPYRELGKHILRYVLVDHSSRAFYVRYYYDRGENALNLIDFLWHAWRRREAAEDIFHGVPRMLYFDPGSANLAHATTNLLDALQVRWEAHQAGVARATGMVEAHQGIWQQAFESKLWREPPADLDELNARADRERVRVCRRRLSRQKASRFGLWSQARDIRLLPPWEVYQELIEERPHRTRVTKDKIVRHRKAAHLLLDDMNVGETLEVVRNPYRLPELIIYRLNLDGTRGSQVRSRFVADEGELAVPVGTYRRLPDTPAQRAMKAAAEVDLEPIRRVDRGEAGLPEPAPAYLERPGEEIAVEPPAPPMPMCRALYSIGVS